VAARLRIFLLSALAAGALAVPAANAGLLDPVLGLVAPSCGSASYPFAQFGDAHSYYPLPNNGFEGGAYGWRLSGATVVSGNEPWYAGGFGSHSLAIAPHGTAASPLVCIGLLDPYFRMFARSNGANGDLHAQVYFYGLTGNLTGILNVDDFSPADYGSWAPSGDVPSALALPLLTSYAQLRLSSGASSGTWQVDDAFVDPWISRVG